MEAGEGDVPDEELLGAAGLTQQYGPGVDDDIAADPAAVRAACERRVTEERMQLLLLLWDVMSFVLGLCGPK